MIPCWRANVVRYLEMIATDGKRSLVGWVLAVTAICLFAVGFLGSDAKAGSPDQELLDRELRKYGEEVWEEFLRTCDLPICKFRNYILSQDWDHLYDLLDKNHPLASGTKEEFLQTIHHNLEDLEEKVLVRYIHDNGADGPKLPAVDAVEINGFTYMDRYRNQFRIVFDIDHIFDRPMGKLIYRLKVDFAVADMGGGRLYPELGALSDFDLSKLYVVKQ